MPLGTFALSQAYLCSSGHRWMGPYFMVDNEVNCHLTSVKVEWNKHMQLNNVSSAFARTPKGSVAASNWNTASAPLPKAMRWACCLFLEMFDSPVNMLVQASDSSFLDGLHGIWKSLCKMTTLKILYALSLSVYAQAHAHTHRQHEQTVAFSKVMVSFIYSPLKWYLHFRK